MARSATYVVPYRRKRSGQTNYRKRLNLLKSGIHRLVIRMSNKYILIQVVDYKKEGDIIVACSHSSELKKLGWRHHCGNIPAAYLTGFLCGGRCKEIGIEECILDSGARPSVRGSGIYAALKGIIDAGIKVPVDNIVFPTEDRIMGRHIMEYRDDKNIEKEFKTIKENITNLLLKNKST